jgi:signal transduction histidine kinase
MTIPSDVHPSPSGGNPGAPKDVKLQQEHRHMLRQLRHSHDEMDHFVRALSHDMSANFMLLESSFSRLKRALDEPSRSGLGELVAHVEACLRESKRFLDDLVGLARTGRVEMDPSRVEVAAVVDEVLFEQGELLAGRNCRVDVRAPLPAVWCNRHRLKQVLTNLVRNAIKHGCDPRKPQITISSVADGVGGTELADRGMASIRIWDNGPGIDPRFHEEIFLPGRRLSHTGGDGSGMGLAIVRKIIQHYGGGIRVDPECREGTGLVVSLPTPPRNVPEPHRPSGFASAPGVTGRSLGRDAPHEDQRPHQHPVRHERLGPRGRR